MVAMREDAGGCESRQGRAHNSHTASDTPNEEHVEAVLRRCIEDVTSALIRNVRNERRKRILLSDEAWNVILRNALFHVIKVVSFHGANHEGPSESLFRRYSAYEQFADDELGPDFIRLCQSLHKWREGQQKPGTDSKG